jgi:bile acid:Na+ symporter, BASS family
VFGFGLKATAGDLLYLVQRPGLFARSLLAMFVVMPIFAVALDRVFDFRPEVEIVLVALAISPVPPLLPQREAHSGGHASYGLGLMALLALVSIMAVPASLAILEWVVGRQLRMPPGTIAGLMIKAVLAPLAAGMVVRAMRPALAQRLEKPVALVAKVLLPLAIVALLVATVPAMWALVGEGTLLALVLFTVAGLVIGHALGGPDPDHAVVLAFSTACRHPALALAIATTNFPDLRFGALILLYALVNAALGIPYVAWHRKHAAGAVHA